MVVILSSVSLFELDNDLINSSFPPKTIPASTAKPINISGQVSKALLAGFFNIEAKLIKINPILTVT